MRNFPEKSLGENPKFLAPHPRRKTLGKTERGKAQQRQRMKNASNIQERRTDERNKIKTRSKGRI